MVMLNFKTFQQLVHTEFKNVAVPNGPFRRAGVQDYLTAVIGYISRGLQDVDLLLAEQQIDTRKATEYLTDSSLEMASFLYAAGAEHVVWRRWSSLTACGMLLMGEIYPAAQYAILGGEWHLLPFLPLIDLDTQQVSDQVLWRLVTGKLDSDLPIETDDEHDHAWLKLLTSIPRNDYATTEEALKTIADFWMGEAEGDWAEFHVRSYPDFETPVCAVAALARHHGFMPTSLSADQYQFLEAGLAEPEPPSLFPAHFTVPAFDK